MKKISHFILTLLSNFKVMWEMFSNFVAFSQYPNFTSVGPSRETYKLRILCAFAQRGQKLHEFAIDYILKFMFSKMATKIDEIFTADLSLCSKCQIDGEDFVIFCCLLRKHKL